MKVKNRRKSGCCSVNFAKNFFHIYNFIFLVSGGCVLFLGLWTILTKHGYVSLLTNLTYPLTAYILVAAGVLSVIVALLGCCSVYKENRCLLILYTFLLLFIFLMEEMVGILAYVYRNQVEADLQHNLNDTFVQQYGFGIEETFAIDKMQQEYKCCGASGFENWENSRWKHETNTTNLVPDSCCKSVSEGCGKSQHPSNIPYTGCVHKFTFDLQDQLVIMCAVGLGFSVIEIFGMILSCCLYVKLKDDDWQCRVDL